MGTPTLPNRSGESWHADMLASSLSGSEPRYNSLRLRGMLLCLCSLIGFWPDHSPGANVL